MNDFVRLLCPAELQFLQPVIVEDLCRIGNLSDGGYAMTSAAIKKSDTFLSLGLGENWSFEKAVSSINPNATIDIYDDTVSFVFFIRKAFNGLARLVLFRDSKSNFFARLWRLKEYFSFWVKNPMNTHHQIHINKESFDKHVDQLRNFLGNLSGSFVIAHLHANNFETLGSNGFPRVFEITLLRERNVTTSGESRKALPIHELDAPNAKNRPDYFIEF